MKFLDKLKQKFSRIKVSDMKNSGMSAQPGWDIPLYNYENWVVFGLIVFVIGFLLSGVILPPLLKYSLKWMVKLKPGSPARDLYNEVPFPITFNVYVFNITNPDDVQVGERPHLQQLGPYTFYEMRTRPYQTDKRKTDILEYTLYNSFYFKPNISGNGLIGNEIITIPHPVIFPLGLTAKLVRQPMLPVVQNAIDILFDNPKNLFWTGTVMDFLFNGIFINCHRESFDAKAICSIFESGRIRTITPVPHTDNLYKFSFFHNFNNTPIGPWQVLRGSKKINRLGKVVEFEEQPQITSWSGPDCNLYRGTDSSVFQPYLSADQPLWYFEWILCRAMMVHHVGKSNYLGLSTHEYHMDFGDIGHDEGKRCFCRSIKDCPSKGTMDMFPCYKVPITVSKPHFYDGDPKILENVVGLLPNKSEHDFHMHIELTTGVPVNTVKRYQFNYETFPVPELQHFDQLKNMLLPILWFEELNEYDATIVNMFKHQLLFAMKLRVAIKLTVCTVCPTICVICSLLYCATQHKREAKKTENYHSRRTSSEFVEPPPIPQNAMVDTAWHMMAPHQLKATQDYYKMGPLNNLPSELRE